MQKSLTFNRPENNSSYLDRTSDSLFCVLCDYKAQDVKKGAHLLLRRVWDTQTEEDNKVGWIQTLQRRYNSQAQPRPLQVRIKATVHQFSVLWSHTPQIALAQTSVVLAKATASLPLCRNSNGAV
ncbi:hypothetical protein RRG08_015915 [Elysia crispata]|uniref:Uncharacterized protein n=1 Tax=Elysia crispata TaxID=231223 RepID=A0AAE1ANP4_9GAST|nr:hypothetical protein RRG08_015915 [Elysia crispata]